MNNNKSLAIVVVVVVVAILVATSFVGTNDVFAGKKRYKKNQATSQANACGNGELPLDVYCLDMNSHIQCEENLSALSGFQG